MSVSSNDFIEVFNRSRVRQVFLVNAYNLQETEVINGVSHFEFTLPLNDPNNEYCQPFFFIRYKNGQLYRIMAGGGTITETGDWLYRAEHVWALLIDDILENDHVVGNVGMFTRTVIEYVLARQLTRNWILGRCDFNHQYEYGWTDETLLSALTSIPNTFLDPFLWTFDTSSYPYVLNLILLNPNALPEMYIRQGLNQLQVVHTSDATTIATRIFPRGYGEGINKLTIASVNNGRTFIQSPPDIIAKYGIISRVWTDRKYTTAQSLLDTARVMLNALQEPFEQYEVDFAVISSDSFSIPEVGKLVEIVDFKTTFITKIVWQHDEIANTRISIANKPKDIAGSIADMLNRQRIETTYAQGATQFWQNHWYDNADTAHPLRMNVFLPSDLVIINWVRLDVQISPFRMPFSITGGGGATATTTNAGGASTPTSSSGGATVTSTTFQGQQTPTTTFHGQQFPTTSFHGQMSPTTNIAGGNITINIPANDTGTARRVGSGNWQTHPDNHIHQVHSWRTPSQNINHHHNVFIPGHSHNVSIPGHSHNVAIPGHSHNVTLPNHTHTVSIPNHTHGFSLPNHTHTMTPGMSLSGNPTSFTIRVNGVNRQIVNGRNFQGVITQWLFNAQNVIPRNTNHVFEIIPNAPAYVMITVNVQGFIQSRGGVVA